MILTHQQIAMLFYPQGCAEYKLRAQSRLVYQTISSIKCRDTMTSDAASPGHARSAAIVSRIADDLFSDECEVWVQQCLNNLEKLDLPEHFGC